MCMHARTHTHTHTHTHKHHKHGNFRGVEIFAVFVGTQLTSKISIASFHKISASRESHIAMSILKYIHPISSFDDELSCSVPTATIKEVNHRVLEVQKNGKKRGQYSKFSDNKKALIGKYRVRKPAWCFKGGEAFYRYDVERKYSEGLEKPLP